MARPFAYFSPHRNPTPTGKDEPAEPSPVNGSDTYTFAPAMSHALIPALPLAPALTDAAVDSIVRYLEADFQRFLRTILEARPPVFVPQPLVIPVNPCKRLLKARFPELYCGKTHIGCYNFIQ